MSAGLVRVRPNTYVDSVLLMSATRAMRASPGVEWAAAVMGTPANLEDLLALGVEESRGASANDLVLAARAASQEEVEAALDAGERALTERRPREGRPEARRPRGLDEALVALPGANLALVSVPGEFAGLEAHKALSAGLHVMLFSDNVPLSQEIELKGRGEDLGLLVMGPGAGTAMLGETGLAFANVVRSGPVGVVAAAGTGAQEVMSLLDRWGAGVSHAIGVGGRDLSEAVGGRMARLALRALRDDPATEVVLLVSKPPAPEVAAAVLGDAGPKPLVAALVGLEEPLPAPDRVHVEHSLEGGVLRTLEILGVPPPDPAAGLRIRVASALAGLDEGRRAVRGLFSGGTLCLESMVVMAPRLGPVHSNVPLRREWGLPAPVGAHVCLDLGEEEFTRGRPHPMIDPEARAEWIAREAADPSVAVLLVDVVLGHGAHPDPASLLGPACRKAASPGGPVVVAYVLGTDKDPQGRAEQCRALEEAGCIALSPTCARAALMAAAVASRRPGMAEEAP